MVLHASVDGWKNRLAREIPGAFLLLLLMTLSAGAGQTKTITLPLTIDYPLLEALTVQSAFMDPGQTARLLETEDGCTRVTVSNPRWSEENGLIRFEVYVDLMAGKGFNDSCLMPVAWQGYVVSLQEPKIGPDSWDLSFKPVDITIYDRHRRPTKISAILSPLLASWVFPYLDEIRIDLAPPVDDLKQVLLPMFADPDQAAARKVLNSMRPGDTLVKSDHLRVTILADTDVSGPDETAAAKPVPLSQGELDRFIRVWEPWDALLVHMFLSLTDKTLTADDQQVLLDTLLQTRHHFSAGLADDNVGDDFVRKQFIWVWERIGPILRRYLVEKPGGQAFGYLAFFTAADALATLDNLGPSLGIEISREGLIRLARLLDDLPGDSLEYPPEADFRLRQIFGLQPTPEKTDNESPLAPNNAVPPGPETDKQSRRQPLLNFLFTPRQAVAGQKPSVMDRLRPWIVPKAGVNNYLRRIRALLNETARKVMRKSDRLQEYRTLYQHLVYATAWQESCFRQFHTKNNQLVYLRSYNGSSVGLMQINERVWRGIYDLNRLRWDIRYNAWAGCDILAIYFERYALKRPDRIRSLRPVELAGVVYAMYNGGPGQFKKFLARLKTGKYYLSDRLFKEKFIWVTKNRWEAINRCLITG